MLYAGLTSVTFRNLDAKRVAAAASLNGLKVIEWGADVHARPDNAEAIGDIVKITAEAGLRCCSYGSYYRAGCGNEFPFDAVLGAAKRLGASVIRVWAGNKDSAYMSNEALDGLVKDLRNICRAAEQYGIKVATEFHHGTYADNAAGVSELIRRCPGLRTYWQENPQIPFDENLRELSVLLPYIENVHVFKFDKRCDRYPLAEAEANWRQYVKIISGAGRDVNMLLEFVKGDGEEQFGRDASALKGFIGL
jgi:sugar phosphate isomerase/epimerase